ncbi:hypothetical protein [Archangium sp.]|uniref:hypothetical protein n=1 Tax=Archangium sp. TaxID=1872627 RepID=UPI00286D021F|nr:hypothetical protein [Archangium sp.]
MFKRRVSARGWVLGLVGLVLAGCATHRPPGGTLLAGLRPGGRPLVASASAAPGGEESAVAGSGGGVGAQPGVERLVLEGGTGGVLAQPIRSRVSARRVDDGHEEARERARSVEGTRAEALVRAAREEGREPEEARKAETERALAWMVGVASGAREVGTRLVFTFWVHEGALTPLGYQEARGGGSTGRVVEAHGLERELRPLFTRPLGRSTGEVVLTLRREEGRWAVDYDATREGTRPAEARTLAVGTRGTPSVTFLAVHEAMRKGLRAVQVWEGGAARVELMVELEDGRLTGWELVEARHTRQGTGGHPRALSSEVAGNAVQGVLAFTEGLGQRTVRLVLRVEHRTGEAEARGRVEEARVERPSLALALTPEQNWYHAMHEALLLRWREGVYEGSAWLAQKGVEEAALWFVGGMVGKGLGSFMTKGLEWVPKALGQEPEVAAGWLRSALKRLPNQEQKAFEQLWKKMALEGEQALTQGERSALRGLFVRLEQVVQEPLGTDPKKLLRAEARKYYKELYPQLARALDKLAKELPIHHRRPLQYAHLFPADDINAAENLATLRKYVHDQISFLWGRFRMAQPDPTADEVRRSAEIIDRHFEPWYHRVDDPPGLSRTAEEAREAALRELRSHFPGLE